MVFYLCLQITNISYNNNYKKMDKSSTSIKSKFKSNFCPKFKNKTKRQTFETKLQNNEKFYHPPLARSKNSTIPLNNNKTTCFILSQTLKCYISSPLLQQLYTLYSHLYGKSSLLLYEFFKLRIYTLSSIFLSLISLVKAYSTTTLEPLVEISEHDLVVCIPENYTNSSNCVKYINSTHHGLIELNESLYPALKAFRGSYDYQMIARINPFWLTFEPPSDTSYYVMGTLYMIIFGFGVTGNGLVLYMFARCKSLRTASNILVFNLALCDFMIVVKCPMAAYNNFMRGPALGDWGCRFYGFLGGFSGTASIGMLTVIAMDRYSVVVNPLSPLRSNNQTKCYYILLLVAWLDAFVFSVIPLLEVGLSVYVPEGYLTTCSFDYLDKSMAARIFMFLFFFFAWCVPLTIIFYCYYHILNAVFRSQKIQSNHNKQKLEIRLAFIVLLVIGLWFLAWTPYSIVAMAGVFGMERYLTPTRSMIPALFCKTAACFNPFLYTISHKRFRNELQRLFCKRKPIYQYSMTRSSYLTRSSRRTRNRVELYNDGVLDDKKLDTYRNSLRSRISIEPENMGDIVNTSLYAAGDPCASVFHHRQQQPHQRHKKSMYSKQQISPIVSSEEAGIFVVDVEDFKGPKNQPLETDL